MTVGLLWLQLAAAAIIILGASSFLAKSADVIAFKTGLGRAFIGGVLLATATSLPELGTGIGAVTFVGEPDLAAGDAFGSNLFNLLIIGLLDLFWRRGPILTSVTTSSVVVGTLGIVVIALAGVTIAIHTTTTTISSWYISPASVTMLLVFLAALYLIYRYEQLPVMGQGPKSDDSQEAALKVDQAQDPEHEYADHTLSRAALVYIASAGAIVGAALWLASTGDRVADEMGWEASFMGTQFLALSTSLPELSASFAALRINAPELAITNLLGSNLFNMGFVLFMDDIAYSKGVVWAAVSQIHSLTALVAVLMTGVVIMALFSRPRGRPGKYWTIEAVLLIALYIGASVLVFYLG